METNKQLINALHLVLGEAAARDKGAPDSDERSQNYAIWERVLYTLASVLSDEELRQLIARQNSDSNWEATVAACRERIKSARAAAFADVS